MHLPALKSRAGPHSVSCEREKKGTQIHATCTCKSAERERDRDRERETETETETETEREGDRDRDREGGEGSIQRRGLVSPQTPCLFPS